jgi:threonine dehydrogenase-like Zn-dependent dehydrogenase
VKCNLLKINGDNTVSTIVWDKPDHTDDQLVVKNIMTGICSSDVAMYSGKMGMLPIGMHGHEGLGEVTEIGKHVKNVRIGDIVATRGEPAYAEYYNVRDKEFVVVPEALPKYILEPVACAVNIAEKISDASGKSVLIIGSGFLARIVYQVLAYNNKNMLNTVVVGNAYSEWWQSNLRSKQYEEGMQFDIVIDLSSDIKWFKADLLNADGHYLMCAEKSVNNLDFAPFLWKSITVDFPSPRSKAFYNAMVKAKVLVENNIIKVDDMWGQAYDISDAQQAFDNRVNGKDKQRTYVTWQQ